MIVAGNSPSPPSHTKHTARMGVDSCQRIKYNPYFLRRLEL